MLRITKKLMVSGLMLGLSISACNLATAGTLVNQDGTLTFIEEPGIMEFSGMMMARRVQVNDFIRQGLSVSNAQARYAAAGDRLAGWLYEHQEQIDVQVFVLPENMNEEQIANMLMATGDYEYVHPNWIVYPLENCPDDGFFGYQYAHTVMNSCLGWDLHTGKPTISVGICDTGVRATHQDIVNYTLKGYNAVDRLWEDQGGKTNDINGHGTACTGCAAAEGNNTVGVAGVGWNLSHRMLRVTNDPGGGAYMNDLINAATTSIEAGDKVASVSYSGVTESVVESTGLYIMNDLNGLLVWAAGNESTRYDSPDWEHVIIVGATDENDNRASFSNYGKFIDVMAPGVDVLTTHYSADNEYAFWSGTSFSCPITAGLCALLFSFNPAMSAQGIMDALYAGADDMGDSNLYGWGRINVAKSLSMVSPVEPDDTTARISISSYDEQGNGISIRPALSTDGTLIAFESAANNLVSNDTNGVSDIFLRDTFNNLTTRISVDSAGNQGNGNSSLAAISGDGNIIAFVSDSTNLISALDENGFPDIYVHTISTGDTIIISNGMSGQPANGASSSPAISTDGKFVAFHSLASNLVANDTNAKSDVFVYDMTTKLIKRVSVSSTGIQGNGNSYQPSLSADGRYVAYQTEAENIAIGDSNGVSDIVVYDRQTGAVSRMSLDSQGRQSNGASINPCISGDALFVVFESKATTLVNGDFNGVSDIFLRDIAAAKTTRISINDAGFEANDDSYNPVISSDARFIAFESRARNLIKGDNNKRRDIYVRDRKFGKITRESIPDSRTDADGHSFNAAVSANGEVIAFDSIATDMIIDDTNGVSDVFTRNRNLTYRLIVPDLIIGQEAELFVKGATPGIMQYLVYSINGPGEYYVKQLGIIIDLKKPKLAANDFSDDNGKITWTIKVPSVAQGMEIWLQNVEKSNKTEVIDTIVQ